MNEYWRKQVPDKPLFPDLIWNKPEQKNLAGKLLIIGGNLHSISAPNLAFNYALKAGIGECRVVMPLSTRKFFGKNPPLNIEFLTSTPSGSFGSKAYDEILQLANWADGILFAGDIGKNSETSILVDELSKLNIPKTFVNDCVEPFINSPQYILSDISCLLVPSFSQLQKISQSIKSPYALTSTLEIAQLAEKLYLFTKDKSAGLITEHNKTIYFSRNGEVVTTKFEHTNNWSLAVATEASVWWIQNPAKMYEAVSTAISQAID